ncbi:MAG: flagellar basal body rod protein FlgB [Lachnospiraceae bacterium]|nr:flagellar basal body rod protein FlgB [Lachnospiraceae bacterium]
MIGSNAYNYINVLTKAADASWTRNEILTNNLANVDTPGYKRKDVTFQSYLMQELASGDSTSLRTRINDADVSNINATVYTDLSTLSYRLDGNNVDVDTENVELASNQLYYQTVLDTINHQFAMLKAAMQRS